jgi:ABC-type branched-subunit amino acid transport system ATPase component
MPAPRLRMFAGPNGSGKSTIKSVLPEKLLGVYLNPDEIQAEIEARDFLDLRNYEVETTEDEIVPFFKNSALLKRAALADEAGSLRYRDGKLIFHDVIVNAYFASVAADFLRKKLLERGVSFSLRNRNVLT